MRILLDTNVVMDALAQREPFNKEAEQIFLYCEDGLVSGCLSGNSMADIYYLLRKHYAEEVVRKHMRNFIKLFSILPVGESESAIALNSPIKDFEDALQAACAERSGIDYIITRDSDFLNQCPLAITPLVFIKTMTLNS